VLVAALLIAAVFVPLLLIAAVAIPLLLYPKGLRLSATRRKPACALDAYVQLAEEAYGNVGYIQGLWTYRHLVSEPAKPTAEAEVTHAVMPAGSSVWE
jgi:hypothetical protein